MHGIGFELPLHEWFDFKLPKTTIQSNFIGNCLESELMTLAKPSAKPLWLGRTPLVSHFTKSKRGETWEMIQLMVHDKRESIEINLVREHGEWFFKQISKMSIYSDKNPSIGELKTDFESKFDDFELFWYSKPINQLREAGLLVV